MRDFGGSVTSQGCHILGRSGGIRTDPERNMADTSTRRGPRRLALTAGLAVATVLLAACSGGSGRGADGPAVPAASDVTLAVAPASFDLAVGADRRLLLAVFTDRRERVAGGTVAVRLAYLGEEPGGQAALGEPLTATFLPIPGLDIPAPEQGPAIVGTDVLTGVYRVDVDLDAAGYWGVSVTADLLDVGTVEGRAVLRVLPEPEVVGVGDPAPPTPNLIRADVEAGRAAPSALDSRLRTLEDPDRAASLHTTRIDESLAAGRPLVVAIATPVYCVSLVCGPLTDFLVDVAERFGDRADFVHIEVWEDFEQQRLNPAAAVWIQTETGGNEPWVFLIDATGTVTARWDNVVDPTELEAALSALPVLDRTRDAG
jgi:hypothetical protein